jgi:hypothetical protein
LNFISCLNDATPNEGEELPINMKRGLVEELPINIKRGPGGGTPPLT